MPDSKHLSVGASKSILLFRHSPPLEYLAVSPSVTGPYITQLLYISTHSPAGLRVADGHKHRPVESPGDAKRLVAPRVPVHRVVRVLQKVWGFLVDQAVRVFVLAALALTWHSFLPGSIFRYYTPLRIKLWVLVIQLGNRRAVGGQTSGPSSTRTKTCTVWTEGPKR